MAEIKIIDKVWLHETAKWNACLQAYEKNNSLIFIAWFEETQSKLQQYFTQNKMLTAQVFLYRNIHVHMLAKVQLIFVEHYPLSTKEQEFYSSLSLKEAIVFSSLDEPLFKYFGGDRITVIASKLGVNEDEALEHQMITSALLNAQHKLEKKILLEQFAKSQKEWFSKNIP